MDTNSRIHRNYFSTEAIEDQLGELNAEIIEVVGSKLDKRVLVGKIVKDWLRLYYKEKATNIVKLFELKTRHGK